MTDMFSRKSVFSKSIRCQIGTIPNVRTSELKAQVNFNERICQLSVVGVFFSRTTWPVATKLGTKHPSVKGISFVYIKGHVLIQEEMIMK